MPHKLASLSQVICDIYDAAVDATLWPKAMQSSCIFIGGSQALIFWHDATDAELTATHLYNTDLHFLQLYVEKYVALNPIFPAALFSDVAAVGRVHSSTDLVPMDEQKETRFYKEWVEPQGITDTLAVALEKERMSGAYFVLYWTGGVTDDDTRHRMALLVPHLQRAVAIGRLFVKHQTTENALTDTLNHLDVAVFLIVGNGNITFANAAGLTMIEQRTLLRVQGDALEAVDHAADRALKDGLRAIETNKLKTGVQGITVTLSDSKDHRWIANVLPLVDGARRRTGETHDAIAAVFVRNSFFSIPTQLETLSRRYHLTASEVRVLDAIMNVSGIKAIAVKLGISDATVKTHLNHIYRKCGAKNQSDLIKLIAGIGH